MRKMRNKIIKTKIIKKEKEIKTPYWRVREIKEEEENKNRENMVFPKRKYSWWGKV